MRGYYFITDAGLSRRGSASDVQHALAAGVRTFQYRNKSGSTREMVEEARALRKLCHHRLFLINDRVDVCMAAGADGVHLGQDDMPPATARKLLGDGMVIGVTVHSVEEAQEAQRHGADYLAVSPIFRTRTKKDAGKAAGIELIRQVKKHTHLPLAAIGGISLANAHWVIDAGADCLCAISAVLPAENVTLEVEKFQRLYGIKPKSH